MAKKSHKLAITTSTFAEFDLSGLESLKQAGFEIVINSSGGKLKQEEVARLCSGCVGIIAGTEEYSAEVLNKLPALKVISRCGSGTENIDKIAAQKLKIDIFSTADAPVTAVAELTVALMLGLLRQLPRMDREMRQGKWDKRMGNLLRGKKVGIVGFGRIGKKVAELLASFGVQLAYSDPQSAGVVAGIERMDLAGLLAWADIVSVHVAGKERLLGCAELKLMRKGSWLFNLSRGGSIDEGVLLKMLKNGHLAGAAIDVFEQEPYNGALKELDNVILTPHIGSYAREARIEMEKEAVRNLLHGLKEAYGE